MNDKTPKIETLDDLAKFANYSLIETLSCDPSASAEGNDFFSREVLSGHYVPVKPTPLKNPEYITHSKILFHELGFKDDLAKSDDFVDRKN